MGLELRATNGRLTYIRETGRIDEREHMQNETKPCLLPPSTGWYCTRPSGHEGPCAAVPVQDVYDLTPSERADEPDTAFYRGMAYGFIGSAVLWVALYVLIRCMVGTW